MILKEALIQHWRELLPAGAAAVLAVGAGFYWLRPKQEDPQQIERERRAYVNRIGRIVEGHILEIVDHPIEPPKPARSGFLGSRDSSKRVNGSSNHAVKLLYYTYSISGVTYETAQDISGLPERQLLERVVAGQAASVKYDPSNPSNSILMADGWSGLK
jgi:hypothetical protein